MERLKSGPANTVGYCAVISPKTDFWQAYFIREEAELLAGAVELQQNALLMASEASPFGSLQGALAHGALENQQGIIGAAALALLGASGDRFFYVIADSQPNGIYTEFKPIVANSIDEARTAINAIPEVIAIKKRLTEKLAMGVGMGRRKAFH